MKKIIFLMSIVFILSWYANWQSFSHFPATEISHKNRTVNWYNIISYEWRATSSRLKINLNEIEDIVKNIWNIWFLKYSYYWRNEFYNIYDNNLNLRNLWERKLNYPIIAFSYENNFIMLIPRENLNNSQINVIKNEYISGNFSVIKYWNNWYILKQKTNRNPERYFYYEEYFSTLKTLSRLNLVNFQLWQNPFRRYSLRNFSNSFIQVEIINNWKLNWIIMDLYRRLEISQPGSVVYWQEYYRDELMMINIVSLYYSVRNYKNTMWWIPNDIWAMHPNFLDITNFNKYYHNVSYIKTNNLCYEAWFIPKSNEFKNKFKNEIINWYWISKNCY